MTKPSKLRGVGIGAGYFAPFQYEAWTRIPEVEITAICDRSEPKARALMAQFDIPRYYDDWKRMIDTERPTFVDIITPPEAHEEMCDFAASRRVSIICQKPLAPTTEASKRIVESARAADVRFMVHENWRWQPWYRKIKGISEAGTIGTFTHIHSLTRLGDGWGDTPYSLRQPFFRDYPRLLFYETGVHFVDTFRFLLGEVSTVFAQLRRLNPIIRGEDAGRLLLTFRGGATALWDANRYNEADTDTPRFTFGQLRIDGSLGHLTMDSDSTIRLKMLGQPIRDVQYLRENQNFAGDCVYFVQRHFVDCMLSGKEFESNGEDYLRTIRVVEAAYDSAMRSEVVALASD
jgi:predicted dehydrogenase